MIRQFTVELTAADEDDIRGAIAGGASIKPDPHPGKKTFAFNETALMAISDGNFECFLWSAFDRVEERGGVITLARGADLVFCLPVAKMEDPAIRRAIREFVAGRVASTGSNGRRAVSNA